MEKVIKWAIFGPGNIANKFADAIKTVADAKLIGVAGRSIAKSQAFADKHQIPKVYASLEELATDSEIDVVYVSVIHPLHYAAVLKLLENRKAVLCEKPITVNAAQLTTLIEASKKHQTFLMEAMWTRFLPVMQKVHQWVNSGLIGKLKMIYADFGFSADYILPSRIFSPELGGGALLDVGVYTLAFAQDFAGEFDSVHGIATLTTSHVDSCNAVTIRFKNEVLGLLSSGVETFSTNQARLVGTQGEITIPDFYGATQATLTLRDSNQTQTFSSPFESNGFLYEILEVQKCVRENLLESPIMPLAHSLILQKTMDKLMQSWSNQ